MDLDPKTTSESSVGGDQVGNRDQLPPTESIAEGLLKRRYLLGPELGRGGFAITYLAADLEVASRKVVVKILSDRRSGDSWSIEKFSSEMEALARIDHPNVVSVIDFGHRSDGKPFLVMQYIAGHSLRQMIPREGLPLPQVAHIVKQIGRALTAAHDAGICHRDLKPENIMIQAAGEGEERIKLIDFGIAGVGQSEAEWQSNTISGTSCYMAPEQFEGRSSAASDIYQMGVLAYELVTGIVPFRASTPGGIILQHMQGLKVPPRDLRPDLPEIAQEAILKALSVNPRDRYQRAKDFGDALATALVSADLETAEWIKPRSRVGSSSRRRIPGVSKPRIPAWLVAVAFSLALAVAASIAGFYFLHSGGIKGDSVAVLPFQNRTGDPELAYVTEGITESLINDLSRIPTLRVSALASVLKYDTAKLDARAAGRELGASRLIDGSVSRHGGDLFLDAELIDVRSGIRLWGNAYTGKMSSLPDVLQQFSTEVTDKLRLKLSGPLKERLKRQYATGSYSYQQYLKGRFHLNKRTKADFDEAIRYFNQGIASDPDYAPAYAGLADVYGLMAFFGRDEGGVQPAYALEKARSAAERALQLDGTLAEAYAARAFVEMQADYRWEEAEKDFLRSIELNPNWAETYEGYALELVALGRFDEAVREIKTAEELEPDQSGFHDAHALVLSMARRNEESIALLKASAKSSADPGFIGDVLAMNYWDEGRPSDALAAVQGIPSTVAPHLRVPLLVAGYARAGQMEKARHILESYTLRAETAWWYYLALAHMSLGRSDDAIHDLEAAYEDRDEEVIWLGVDPDFDSLRADPRFQRLLQRTNLVRKQ